MADYRAIPGVEDATVLFRQQFPIIPPITLSLCGRIDGTTYHYYGRVPGIGTFYYTSQPGVVPQSVGSDQGSAPPPWSGDARLCFARLVDGLAP